MIKRFLMVAVSAGLLAGSAWLTTGSAVAGEDPPVSDDPHAACGVCW
ncbi:hypothetical protein [Kribbella sp. ALI-6-A]|nr:hypothetical protein [Kribbella sp. ALI-6-A]